MERNCRFLVFVSCVCAAWGGWMEELVTKKGLEIVEGASVRLEPNVALNVRNVSLFERHRLRFDFHGMVLSIGKVPKNDVLQVGIYYEDREKGRSTKLGEAMFPIIMGIKVTGLIGVTLIGITLFVAKAFLLSKLAVFLSIGLMIAKYLYPDVHGYRYNDLDHHASETHPAYQYPSATGYDGNINPYNGDANYGGYGGQGASEGYSAQEGTTGNGQENVAAESSVQYSAVAPSNATSSTSSGDSGQQPSTAKRRDSTLRKKPQLLPTYLTVKRYALER